MSFSKEDELIFTRRSVRHFTSQKVEEVKIEKLLRAAMQAPSAMNQQPWEFIVLQNKERIEEVATYTGSQPLSRAPLALVLLADENRLVAPGGWQQDLGASMQNILLEATALGLGAVWIGVATTEEMMEKVRQFFSLPAYIKPFGMVAIGYPEKEENRFIDRFLPERIHYETWE